jgi:ParB-like nuclease domain
MNSRRMAIDEIRIVQRCRQELGGLEALAASIQQHGLIHPIVIAQDGTLVAGERRLKACQLLGWVEIDVRVYEDLTDAERWAIELEENLQRKDLTEYERSKTMMALWRRHRDWRSRRRPEQGPRVRRKKQLGNQVSLTHQRIFVPRWNEKHEPGVAPKKPGPIAMSPNAPALPWPP